MEAVGKRKSFGLNLGSFEYLLAAFECLQEVGKHIMNQEDMLSTELRLYLNKNGKQCGYCIPEIV